MQNNAEGRVTVSPIEQASVFLMTTSELNRRAASVAKQSLKHPFWTPRGMVLGTLLSLYCTEMEYRMYEEESS